jgi:hypothetical protein
MNRANALESPQFLHHRIRVLHVSGADAVRRDPPEKHAAIGGEGDGMVQARRGLHDVGAEMVGEAGNALGAVQVPGGKTNQIRSTCTEEPLDKASKREIWGLKWSARRETRWGRSSFLGQKQKQVQSMCMKEHLVRAV